MRCHMDWLRGLEQNALPHDADELIWPIPSDLKKLHTPDLNHHRHKHK
jgi:hypothetical protein